MKACRAAPLLGAGLLAVLLPAAAAAPEEDEGRLREAARLRSLALAEMEEGACGRALEHLDALAELLPDNVLPPLNRALCLFRLGETERALAALDRAAALAPTNPRVLYARARILLESEAAPGEIEELLERYGALHPADARPHYLAALAATAAGRPEEAGGHLRRGVAREPENLVLLGDLLVAAAAAGDPEGVEDALNAIEDRLDGLEGVLAEWGDRLRGLLREERVEELAPATVVLRNVLRPHGLYQVHLAPLVGRRDGGAELFPQHDFEPPLPPHIQGGQDLEVSFQEVPPGEPDRAGIAPLALRTREPGGETLYGRRDGRLVRLRWEDGGLRLVGEPGPPVGPLVSLHDLDQDGLADVTTVTGEGEVVFYPGLEGGGHGPPRVIAELGPEPVRVLLAVDLDHDGDLDLFLGRSGAPDRFLENAGSEWRERGAEYGLAGGGEAVAGAVAFDADEDGLLDLLVVAEDAPPRLSINRRAQRFGERAAAVGLDRAPAARRAVAFDADGDGRFDLLLWGGGEAGLWLNREEGFVRASLPEEVAGDWAAAAVGDFDNDGDQDVALLRGEEGELWLLRNRRGSWTAEPMGLAAPGADRLLAGDVDGDGSLDLVVGHTSSDASWSVLRAAGGVAPPQRSPATPSSERLASDAKSSPGTRHLSSDRRLVAGSEAGFRLWLNRGAGTNHWLRLVLRGLLEASGKNNSEGLHARIEVRVGDHYQAFVGHGGANHVGLGAARQADVVRVVWTNGVAQTWQLVAADRTLVEEQVLKGSCPFLYTWDGERFVFVTDLLWPSPLGMTLADGSPAPHQAARDWVSIPGEALRPAGGALWLQVTEELWETVYLDRLHLLAVDVPPGAELVVDEAFRPPPRPERPPFHLVAGAVPPLAARDQEGRDLTEALRRRDGVYAGGLPLTRYQGVTRGHHLELTFPETPPGPRRLLLWGWILPTDTTINVALAQDPEREARPPTLEMREEDGSWREILSWLGFPNGKDKAVVAELPEDLPPGPLTLRIVTNLQVYWDAAALAAEATGAGVREHRLEPADAHLHPRGFSGPLPRGGEEPYRFDYSAVDPAPGYPQMAGLATRHGPVTELLAEADDRYAVLAAGDELTVRFDVSALPPPAPGWRREWVLYSEGWVKDGDHHTAAGATIEPLPYHGMASYPDQPVHAYPAERNRDYLELYQTRPVGPEAFRGALRPDHGGGG